jgi:ribonucleoside-diphosphate reductase alpha chain
MGNGGMLSQPAGATDELAGPACMLRPGDPGFEECEACQ